MYRGGCCYKTLIRVHRHFSPSKTGCILKPCAAATLWPLSGDSCNGGAGLHVDVVRATNERDEGGPECFQGAAAGIDIICSSRIWGAVCVALVWGVRLKFFNIIQKCCSNFVV